MPKHQYNIQLKGYVGGYDFDRNTVDSVLAKNDGKEVNVLIDSLGGSLATGLSISAAFKNHGNVNVHFVGLNASAATIASLGAAHISIDAGAMYLVHQCSMAFFEWGSLNSAQFATLIADCEKIKADLDKLDLNVAQLYAARCKRPTADLLALMKVGGWLSAKEALDWGFVDEITDLDDEPAPKLTDALASAMASEGMPIPNIPIAENEKDSPFGRFFSVLTSLLNFKNHTTMSKETPKSEEVHTDNSAVIANLEQQVADRDAIIADREKTIADLQAKLDAKPAASTTTVVENSKSDNKTEPQNEAEAYCQTVNAARKLYNLV